MKVFLVGLWLTVVALGATYAGAIYLSPQGGDGAHAAPVEAVEHEKTRVLNIPMLRDGVVEGFMSVQFIYTMNGATLKSLPVSPEVYLLDEAFRTIYSDPSFDFRHLDKYDLTKMTRSLVESTNAHLGAALIREVLIADLIYTPKDSNAK